MPHRCLQGDSGKEELMLLASWIVVGMLIGWGAGRVLKGDGYGPFMDAVMGIGGAVGGGLLMHSANIGGIGGAMPRPLRR